MPRRITGPIVYRPFSLMNNLNCYDGFGASPENADSFHNGARCRFPLINVATALGKTTDAIIAWLWNRAIHVHSLRRSPGLRFQCESPT